MPQENQDFEKNIFINCPFDSDYRQMLRALIFCVLECGFEPRIASEREDSGEVRVSKIKELIRESRYSIHDISRMEPMKRGDLPRFNMPFELGLDLGCRDFGNEDLPRKKCLILEKEKYRYRKVISDISGNDIRSHASDPEKLVRRTRDWIRTIVNFNIPSGTRLWRRFNEFYADFIETCENLEYNEEDIEGMPEPEYITFVKEWLEQNQEQNENSSVEAFIRRLALSAKHFLSAKGVI